MTEKPHIGEVWDLNFPQLQGGFAPPPDPLFPEIKQNFW